MITINKYRWIIFIFAFFFLLILWNIFFSNTAYAMGPDDINSTGTTGFFGTPEYYWSTYTYQDDAYAFHQKSIYLNVYGKNNFFIEPQQYPIEMDNISLENEISKSVCKSKVAWYMWKKYTKEFNSFREFKRSIDKPFSIRRELKKDFKKVFHNCKKL